MPLIEDGSWLTRPTGVGDDYRRSTGDAAKEIGRQFIGGVAVDLPRTVGEGLRFLNPAGSPGSNLGYDLQEGADARAPQFAPNTTGEGVVGGTLARGARMIGPVAPVIAASALPGGQVAGPALAAGMFGASAAQGTEDKLLSQGVGTGDARTAGMLSGAIQGPLMAASAGIGGMAFRGASSLLGKGAAPSMEALVNQITDTGVVKGAAKTIGMNLLEQPAIMGAATAGQELVERNYGAAPEPLWDKVKDSAQAAIGMTALLGPFVAAAHYTRAKVAASFDAALNDPTAPPEARKMAEDAVISHAQKRGVDPEQIQNWLVSRTQDAQNQQRTEAQAPDATQTSGSEPTGTNMMQGGTPAVVEARKSADEQTAQQQQFTAEQQQRVAQQPPLPTNPTTPPEVIAHPDAGVDPAILAQRQAEAQQQQQQQQAADVERARVEQQKAAIVQRQQSETEASNAFTGGAVDDKGKPIKVPTNFRDTMMEMKLLMKQDLVKPEQAQGFSDRLKAAYETKDLKTLNEVRKELEAIKNPPKPEEKKPAFSVKLPPEKAPSPVVTVPVEKPRAPEKIPEQASVPVQPESRTVGGEAVKASPGDRVLNPAKVAEPAPAEEGYAKYEGRSVTVEVPHADPNKKPIRRTLKNARAALEEADDRVSKFQDLVRCLQS